MKKYIDSFLRSFEYTVLSAKYTLLFTINFLRVLSTFRFYDYEVIKKKCIFTRPSGKKMEFDREIIIRTSRITGFKKYKYGGGYMFNNPWNNPWRDYEDIEGREVLNYVSI